MLFDSSTMTAPPTLMNVARNVSMQGGVTMLFRTVAKPVPCGDVCIASAVLGCLTLFIALYDVYNINTCLGPWATRRHSTHMVLATGLYAFFNACFAVLPMEANTWGGLMALLRIYYVIAYVRLEMCLFCVDGYGEDEEMIEKVGKVLSAKRERDEREKSGSLEPQPPKKGPVLDAEFARACIRRMRLWILQSVASFIIKIVCNTYGVLAVFEGPSPGGLGPSARVRIWSGAFIYLVFIDVIFMVVLKKGQSELCAEMETLLKQGQRPGPDGVIRDAGWLIRGRALLFNIFYLFITMIYPSIIPLIFMCNVGVDDFTYTWWRKHQAIFVAASMLPFQWAVHRYYVPPYHWSFGREVLVKIKNEVTTREQIAGFLDRYHIVIYAKVDAKEDEKDGKSRWW